jgi:hypothetical protein
MEEIFENARQSGECESNIDINDLLETLENVNINYLENKTTKHLYDEMINILTETRTRDIPIIMEKLMKYRYVDEINDLLKGRMVRWIRTGGTNKLTNGGMVTNITFTNNGINVQIMSCNRRFINYKFDECITFQKLTTQEELILMVNEHIDED